MGQRLAEADAGINDQPLAGNAGLLAGRDARIEGVVNIEHDIIVDRVALHGARIALGMHEHDRQPLAAATSRLAGSWARAETSLIRRAPACAARRITSALRVSMETGTRARLAKTLDDGQHAPAFFLDVDRSAPGRVDSPPTSRISAPSASS